MLCVDWGYLHGKATERSGHAGDRGVIVPMKPVKAGGGKDARKVEEDTGMRWKPRTAVPMRPKPDERENQTAHPMLHSGASTGGHPPQGGHERLLLAGDAEAERPSHSETTDWRAVCGKSARTVRR